MSTLDYAGETTTCRTTKGHQAQQTAGRCKRHHYSVFWMEAGMDDSIHILHSVIIVAAMKCKVRELA